MLPKAAIYNFVHDFCDDNNLHTPNELLSKIPELYTYLVQLNLLTEQVTYDIFEKGVREGFSIALQEVQNPQIKMMRKMMRSQR